MHASASSYTTMASLHCKTSHCASAESAMPCQELCGVVLKHRGAAAAGMLVLMHCEFQNLRLHLWVVLESHRRDRRRLATEKHAAHSTGSGFSCLLNRNALRHHA